MKHIITCSLVLLTAFVTGCATNGPTSSQKAHPLEYSGTLPDLKSYEVVTVVPFDTTRAKNTDPSVGVQFAENVTRRLKYDFGQTFKEVSMGNPTGAPNELIVTGDITAYDPGDKALRGLLAGLGAASFKGDLMLKTGTNNLMQLPFDKLWAWGGIMGMSKGIDDMEAEAAASIANTVARQKGWTPAK